ncbi:Cell wall-associated hydrolase, NlpC family [Mycolicibacterium fluoranthenivorans]|uniref:Cell wall-associated hydrolase, NlpC family n=1 Tax=Mycolicibacterium fluoranthenivorans TaxID=258505 RepID=A0A1G4V7B4_9MYCO|nr:Cell wall-associated hydrolase, NlpC family [Mycolicibacterium fluoranthenivorans]
MRRREAIEVTGLLLASAFLAAVTPPVARADDGLFDPSLPQRVSAGAPGDPLALANASLGATRIAAQTTADLGHKFLAALGLASDGPVGGRVRGPQAIEYTIRRAGSQIGVPYSWGGGSLTGPSKGIDSGSGTVGFDCSGLTRFAYAGVGVLLPRWSGDQYNAGRHVAKSEARRGDLLFWGPGGSQHTALYLGNGQMIEAQQTGVPVKVSAVRLPGMTPYVTRVVET